MSVSRRLINFFVRFVQFALLAMISAPSALQAATLGEGVRVTMTGMLIIADEFGRRETIFDQTAIFDGVNPSKGPYFDLPSFSTGGQGGYRDGEGGVSLSLSLLIDVSISMPSKEYFEFEYFIDHGEGYCIIEFDDYRCIGNTYGSQSKFYHHKFNESGIYRIDYYHSSGFGDINYILYDYVQSDFSWSRAVIDPDLAAARRAAAQPPSPVPLPAAGWLLTAGVAPLVGAAMRRRRMKTGALTA